MRKFLFQILCICSIILFIAIVADVYISSSLRRSNDNRFVVWTEIANTKINANTLIMGSSRAWVQFSPKILDSILHTNSYNIGINARTINSQRLRYDFYCSQNIKPNLIIQNIDFMSTISQKSQYAREQFFPYFSNRQFRDIMHYEDITWQEKYIPFYRYCNLDVFRQYQDTSYKVHEKGYIGVERTWDGTVFAQIDTIRFHCNDTLKSMFIDYVQKVKSDSIDIVFVYAPFYIETMNKVINLNEMYSTFDSIAKAYDVPILDYTYSYLSYDTTYFYNASHLNKQGAELFTTMLANDLDSLGIIR